MVNLQAFFTQNLALILASVFVVYLVITAKARREYNREFKKSLDLAKQSLRLHEKANDRLMHLLREAKKSNQTLAHAFGTEAILDKENDPDPNELENRVYVGNLDYTATEEELVNHFAAFGQIEMVNIPVNRYTGKARGFGFVTFASAQDAKNATELHGTKFKGRPIQVNLAKEKSTD